MKLQYVFLFLLIFACLIGCKKTDPRKAGLVSASGTITYNGSPLDGATIVFMPKESAKQGAGALSDASGKFALTTVSDNDGAYSGEYTVYILKEEPLQISDAEALEYSRQGKTPPKPKSLIPVKYTNPDQPLINFTIPAAGEKNLIIELKD
ncbi:MAG: carboxypeptidase-like regulatory domain-containing protein [Planctomycetaceae bacterium]|nr:carboxypeptidase-like regulatory domain-containing protein [Planctomycetaceae bacterium]